MTNIYQSIQSCEKGCKWFFVQEADNHQKQGFQGLDEIFKQGGKWSKEWYFSREILQNSVDARHDKSKPVHVTFSYGIISKDNYPEFFKLSKHVDLCRSGENDNNICDQINSVLDNNIGNIKYLKVSDYNTTGLSDNSIRKIVYSSGYGRDASETKKGGAFGYGHNAYIGMSSIRCFLISSYDEKNEWSFSGLTSLKSHVYENHDVSNYGYYTSDLDGSQIKEYKKIPSDFRRKTEEGYGTDVFVIGCEESVEDNSKLIKAILANFWLAILQKTLTANVNGVEINNTTLDTMIRNYFDDKTPPKMNPLPAYKAVKNIMKGEGNYDVNKYRYFESPELDHIGKVKLFMNINKNDLPNRYVEYMRAPMMLIKAERFSNNMPYNFSGLLLCDNVNGDAVLRSMESPNHENWSIDNIRKTSEKKAYSGVVTSIKDFVQEKVEGIFRSDNIDTIHIDLGSLLNPFLVNKTSDVTSEMGKEKARVNEKKEHIKVKVTKTLGSRAFKDTKGTGIGERGGANITGKGHRKINHHGGNPTAGEGSVYTGVDTNGKGRIGVPIDVTYDVVAININSQLWHRLFITPEDSYENCFIHIGIGTDISNNDKDVVISSAINKGELLPVDGNKIKDIAFTKGQLVIIDVQLSDNIKHSIVIRPLRDE